MYLRILGIAAIAAAVALFVKGWFTLSPDDVAFLESGGSGDSVPSPWPWILAAVICGLLGAALLFTSMRRKP